MELHGYAANVHYSLANDTSVLQYLLLSLHWIETWSNLIPCDSSFYMWRLSESFCSIHIHFPKQTQTIEVNRNKITLEFFFGGKRSNSVSSFCLLLEKSFSRSDEFNKIPGYSGKSVLPKFLRRIDISSPGTAQECFKFKKKLDYSE